MPIVIEKFWSEFRPNRTDASKMEAIHWIEYGALGSIDRTKIRARVSSLRPNTSGAGSGNPTVEMAMERWHQIEPRYLAWLKGEEFPETGTPLAAWNGVNAEQATALKARGIRTVEDIAGMGEGLVERIGMPGTRDLIRAAKAYLEAADQNKFAAELLATQAETQNQNAVIEEQREMIAELMRKVDSLASGRSPAEKPKNRGGRPSNEERARRQAEAEAAAGESVAA